MYKMQLGKTTSTALNLDMKETWWSLVCQKKLIGTVVC